MAMDLKRYENVLRKQTGKAVRPYRADGYVNAINRYGTSKDDTEQYFYNPEPVVDDSLLEMFYENNGLFAKIIDTPAEEAVKHGFSIDGIEDEDLIRFYESAVDELDWEETAMTALKWARLFGGSLAVMLINDGHALEEPLDWRHIRSIDDIVVFDRSIINPDRTSMYKYDPQDPFCTRGSRLGTPEWYEINGPQGAFIVHDSRCLTFRNGVLPYNAQNETYQLWGVPEYVRISRAVRNAEIAHESAPKMLSKSVQPVYKMKDLAMELATEEGEDKVLRRLQAIDMARGLLNSITIDSEGEDYSFQSFGFAGVSDVIDSSCNWLSALTNIPQTILFGRSPAGMNATGEADFENYYNFVERIQKRMLRSNLRYLLSVIFTAGKHTGEVKKIPDINVSFNPLWSMSDTEEAQLESTKLQNEMTRASIAQTYIQNEVITPEEVRVQLGKEDDFDVESMLDDMTEEELIETAPKGQQEGMGGEDPMAAMMGGGGAPQAPQQAPAAPQNEDETNPYYAVYGNSPETAPEATKLPQDMEQEEPDHEDAESKDPNWITTKNGVHIPLDESGEAVGGPLKGSDFSDAKSENASSSESKNKPSDADKDLGSQSSKSSGSEFVKEIPSNAFPAEGNWRRSELNLGWNKERTAFLESKGFSKQDIKDFDSLIELHVQGRDVDEKAKSFISDHKELVSEIASFEIEASKIRREEQKKRADKDIREIEDKIKEIEGKEGFYSSFTDEDIELFKSDAKTKLEHAKWEREQLDKPIVLYRKGDYDSSVLSFTTDRNGVTLHSGSDHEVSLSPDHESELDELISQGIYPVGGFGSKYNFYAGEGSEITCVRVNHEDSEEEPDHEDDSQDPGGLVKRWAAPDYQPPIFEEGDFDKWLVKDFDAIMSFTNDENTSEWVDDEIKRRIRAVGVIVVDKNGKILSGIRKGGDGDNFNLLGGPGGHVEPHESLEDAAIRETYEEFGIVAKDLTFLSLGDYEEDSGMIPAIFLCTEWAGMIYPTDGEMENIRFRTIDDIMSHNLFAPFKSSLEILQNVLTNDENGGIIELTEDEDARFDGNRGNLARATIAKAISLGFDDQDPKNKKDTLNQAIIYLQNEKGITQQDILDEWKNERKESKDRQAQRSAQKGAEQSKREQENKKDRDDLIAAKQEAKNLLPLWIAQYPNKWQLAQSTREPITQGEVYKRAFQAVQLSPANPFPPSRAKYKKHVLQLKEKAFAGMSQKQYNQYVCDLASSRVGENVSGFTRNQGDIMRYDVNKNVLVIVDGNGKFVKSCHELWKANYTNLVPGGIKGRAYYEFQKMVFGWR